jgi:hypothetical protein
MRPRKCAWRSVRRHLVVGERGLDCAHPTHGENEMMSTSPLTRVRRRALIASVCLLAALPAVPAEHTPLPERWLDWRNNYASYPTGLSDCDASKDLAAEWDQNLQRLASAIARSGGAVPKGTYTEADGGLGNSLQDGQPCKGRPLMGQLHMAYWPESSVTAAVGTRPKLKQEHGEHYILTIRLNTFDGLETHVPDFLRDNGKWTGIGLVMQTASLQGFPIINNSAVVITPPGHAPAFVPVPLDRVLKLWLPAQAQAIRDQEDLVKQYPADQRDGLRKRVVPPHQALLARGQALQRQGEAVLKGPAYLRLDRDSLAFEVVAQAGADTSAIMMPNPAYFDPKLARSAVQLMVLGVSGLNLDQPATHNGDSFDSRFLTREFIERVDWKSIAKTELR